MNKLTKLILIIAFWLVPQTSISSGFEIFFGGQGTQVCMDMMVSQDSCIYMFGYTYDGPNGGVDFMLAKINLQGQVLWTRYYGTSMDEFGSAIVHANNSTIVLAGYRQDPILNHQVYLINIDSAGSQLSSYSYGGLGAESISSIKLANNNGFLIFGTQSSGSVNYSYLLKIDSLFMEEWSAAFGAGLNDYATDGLIDSLGNCYLVYDRKSNNGPTGIDYDVGLLKTDNNGVLIWDSTYQYDFQNGGQGLISNLNGHLILFGETETFQFSPFDYFISAVDSNGNQVWRKEFGGVGTNALFDLIQDSNGDLVGTGYGNSFSNGNSPINLVIVKTDSIGDFLWQREYGSSAIDIGYSIKASPDGGYLLAGRTTNQFDSDFYLLKTDINGLVTSRPEEISTFERVRILPNPSTGVFKVESIVDFDSILITDLLGRTIVTKEIEELSSPNRAIEFQLKTKGCYFLYLLKGANVVGKEPLIIN
jgi:hypothetical protein